MLKCILVTSSNEGKKFSICLKMLKSRIIRVKFTENRVQRLNTLR